MNFQLKNEIKLCRLCANAVEGKAQSDLFEENKKLMLEQIKELTGLTLKDMPKQMLPRFFCEDCEKELPKACEFRRNIIKTQNYFKSKEYKQKLKTQRKTKSRAVEKDELSELEALKKTTGVFSEDEHATAMEWNIKTQVKDDDWQTMSSESDDEKPLELIRNRSRRKKPELNDLKLLPKANHHTTNNASQEFDAVFLPLKKEADSEADQTSDDESNKDALEDFSGNETEDPDFELSAKKKYPNTFKHSDTTKTELLTDPRKNPLYCYLCNTTLKTTHAFKVHCRKLHKGEKVFKCDSCEETFWRIKSLVRHNRIHIGGKLFECRYCDMSFNAPTTRIHHERAKHTKDWPFLCPICGKTFITTTRGKEHMTVHTKERPYKCELCKTAYLQRNNFKKHRRSELHKNNEKKLKESMENVQNENQSINEDKNESDVTEK